MAEFGIDKLAQQVGERVAADVAMSATSMELSKSGGDSPIERIFLASLRASTFYHVDEEWDWKLVQAVDDEHLARLKSHDQYQNFLIIQSQVQLDNWRVDFLIHAYADWARYDHGKVAGWRKLIVECDGHEFHERTKEQAGRDRSRDRQAQLANLEVFRFTGSELWRDPLGCALQILKWANAGV